MKPSRIFEDIYFNGVESARLMIRHIGARSRTLPNCFILGVVKGGTSSLAHYISFHPNYIPAFTKEINLLHDLPNNAKYQDGSLLLNSSYGKYNSGDDRAYRKFFPFERQMQQVHSETGLPTYTGDHTPFNFYCSTALKRIKEFSINPKLIVLLRHPADRAYSHFSMNALTFRTEDRSFKEAIEEEMSGVSRGIKRDYLAGSTYYPHMSEIFQLFGRDAVLVIRSEDFFEAPAQVLKNVFEFLELPSPSIGQKLPVVYKGSYDQLIDPKLRDRLGDYFMPLNLKLYDLLETDFKW
jgi:hypothetical protein